MIYEIIKIMFKLSPFHEASPIPHPRVEDYWLVPAYNKNDQWEIFVGKNHKHLYEHAKLPDEIQWRRVFMVVNCTRYKHDYELISNIELFNHNDHTLDEIGWKISDSWYTFALPEDFLLELRGMPVFDYAKRF